VPDISTELFRHGFIRGYTHISERNVLNEGGVQVAAEADLLQQGIHHVLEAGVLEATLLGLAEGRANGERDDDVVGILGLARAGSQSPVTNPAV